MISHYNTVLITVFSCVITFYAMFYLKYVQSKLHPSEMECLKDVGFYFTESGQLKDVDNDEVFEYAKFPEKSKNQLRYEEIGDAITEYIYHLLKTEYELEMINVPSAQVVENQEYSFIFASVGFRTSTKNKLVLINGSGAVRAGQWARSIIVNDNLYSGSMLPYIKLAKKIDWDVIVLNTNEVGESKIGSETPTKHAQTVWNEFLDQIETKSVYIVAHSYGGVIVKNLAKDNAKFGEIISKIGFTDSVHMGRVACSGVPMINWMSSADPLDKIIDEEFGCELRSAGTTQHPWTSHFAMDSIFKWFTDGMDE